MGATSLTLIVRDKDGNIKDGIIKTEEGEIRMGQPKPSNVQVVEQEEFLKMAKVGEKK